MRVINLLPWREGLYRRRRRNFLITLGSITLAGAILACVYYRANLHNRIEYDARVAYLRAALSDLEQQHLELQQASAETVANSKKLQSRLQQWDQRQKWRKLIGEWQQLAEDAYISDITWRTDGLLLNGVTDAAEPLRRLIHRSPQWQLAEIELNAQARFQFLLSRTMPTERGL